MTSTDLTTITLTKGGHDTPSDGLCVMEAVAYFAGEPHSDHPKCASRVLTNFGISLNDNLPDDKRQHLTSLIPHIAGTADDGKDEARGYLALDWLIRTYTPVWLDLAGLTAEATELRSLRRIVDLAAAQSAGPAVRVAREKSDAAWAAAGYVAGYAARDVAGAAAGYAARAAAGYAARDAAGYVAGDAAWVAARHAARVAARDAAQDAAGAAAQDAAGVALAPTVSQLQDSAIDLFAAMVNA